MAEALTVADLVLRRWQRYGHDRVYVERADGRVLGYWDVLARTALAEDSETERQIAAAAEAYLAEKEQCAEPEPAPAVGTATVLRPRWDDLAESLPDLVPAASDRSTTAGPKTVAAFVRTTTKPPRGEAEISVAQRLARLGPEWSVLSSVQMETTGGHIEHVVIGPGGVYTVTTKRHPHDRVWVIGDHLYVDGDETRYVQAAREQADHAERMLNRLATHVVPVVGLIAVVAAPGRFTVRSQPPDGRVTVVAAEEIDTWLRQQRSSFTADQLGAIQADACRDTTWRTS